MPLFKVLQQATLIGYVSAEVADKTKLADDKGTRSPSIFLQNKHKNGFWLPASFFPHKKQSLTQLSWLYVIQIVLF